MLVAALFEINWQCWQGAVPPTCMVLLPIRRRHGLALPECYTVNLQQNAFVSASLLHCPQSSFPASHSAAGSSCWCFYSLQPVLAAGTLPSMGRMGRGCFCSLQPLALKSQL